MLSDPVEQFYDRLVRHHGLNGVIAHRLGIFRTEPHSGLILHEHRVDEVHETVETVFQTGHVGVAVELLERVTLDAIVEFLDGLERHALGLKVLDYVDLGSHVIFFLSDIHYK